jgi:hypothetical protein
LVQKRGPQESAAAVLLKALSFLALAMLFEWALYKLFGAHFSKSITAALKPVFGEYQGFFAVAALANAAFLFVLTWAFLTLDGQGLSAMGFGKRWRYQFWDGMILGFLPGLVLAVPLLLSTFAEIRANTSSVPWVVLGVPCLALISTLQAGGYACRKLRSRFGGAAAVLIGAVFLTAAQRLIFFRQDQKLEDFVLAVVGEFVAYSLLALASVRGGGLWLPAGLQLGLSLVPERGGFAYLWWSWERARIFLCPASGVSDSEFHTC